MSARRFGGYRLVNRAAGIVTRERDTAEARRHHGATSGRAIEDELRFANLHQRSYPAISGNTELVAHFSARLADTGGRNA